MAMVFTIGCVCIIVNIIVAVHLTLYFFNLEGKAMKLKIVIEPSDEGGYTVYVPSSLVVSVRETPKKRSWPISKKPLNCI